MKPEQENRLISWLAQAHALEINAVAAIARRNARLANHPHLQELFAANGRQSQEQAQRLRTCLAVLGGEARLDPEGAVVSEGVPTASLALLRAFAEEDAENGLLALYALKHLEIGSYRLLSEAADRLDEPDIAAVCRHNLAEELDMAGLMESHIAALPDAWDHIPRTTSANLKRACP